MVNGGFPKFVKVVKKAKVACNRFEGALAPHAVALYLPGKFLTLTVAGQTRLVRRKRVLYLLSNIHLSIVVYSILPINS